MRGDHSCVLYALMVSRTRCDSRLLLLGNHCDSDVHPDVSKGVVLLHQVYLGEGEKAVNVYRLGSSYG